jgi:hypothetical protein
MSSGGTAGRPTAAGRPGRWGFAVRGLAGERVARAPSAGELAWIGVVPCALLVVVAIVLLGPPLGRLAFPRAHGLVFWPVFVHPIPPTPEPTEQARFLLALTAPLLLSGFVLLGARRARPRDAVTIARLVQGAQLLALAFVAICCVVQRRYVFGELNAFASTGHTVYFTLATFVVAGAIAVAIAAGLASDEARRRFAVLTRETRGRRIAGSAVALAVLAAWLLSAINFEDTIAGANGAIANHLPFWLDEAFAVLDGRHPLVDFVAQYGSLWPYPIAAAMALLGSTIGVYTVAMATIGAVAMLALFATFRRLVRSTTAGLLLFLPFLATSFFMMEGPLENRYAIVNLFSTFPLRYAGPFLLAWLIARQLDGAPPRRPRWLFAVAAVVVLNNVEFGIPALGGTVAALLWTSADRWTRGRLGRLALEAAIGLAGGFALVSVLTLATAGSLPHPELLVRFTRLFALAGIGMLPLKPAIGMSTIVYLTYAAAIVVATVRAVGREPDRMLTGLLAFAGAFGLGIGSYYVGRSHPEVLVNMFPAWALSVTLLLVVAVRAVASRPSRRPTLAEAACLFAFGVLACSLAQTPTPWSQVERLRRSTFPIYAHPMGEPFMAARTRPGESVAILTQLGHRAAYNLGVVNVAPYAERGSMFTVQQLDETLDALRAAGGRKVFVALSPDWSTLPGAFARRGYAETAREPDGVAELSRGS